MRRENYSMNWVKKNIIFLSVLAFLLINVSMCHGKEIKGVVQKIIDGDSLIIKIKEGKKIEVRLYGIDSPEYDQPYSNLSKRYLVEKILKKTVYLSVVDIDRYKRKVAIVRKGKVIVNSELVRLGYAWVYPKYCKNDFCNAWKKYQKTAKKNKKGLWKDKKPISPWRWKHK